MTPDDLSYRCVDPKIGRLLERREDPQLDAESRELLDLHLDLCHACREQAEFEDGAARELSKAENWTGDLKRAHRPLLAFAAALAAVLAVFFFMTGSPLESGESPYRGEEETFRIERPVEGEVLSLRSPDLRWSRVPEARVYRVTVENLDGSFSRTRTLQETSMALPAETREPGEYLVSVEPIPADLSPLRESNRAFRRAGLLAELGYRALHPPLLSLGALILALGALVLQFRKR